MPEPFAEMLTGGHRNSLGRTEEVVRIVLSDRARLEELFASATNRDELVRMRAGDALEKICRLQPAWFAEHLDQLLDELGAIEQPSIQWHLAQMLQHLRGESSDEQAQRATELLQRNLRQSTDWIVLNVTIDVLADWAAHDPALAAWLIPELDRLRLDARKSVARRASKRISELTRQDRDELRRDRAGLRAGAEGPP